MYGALAFNDSLCASFFLYENAKIKQVAVKLEIVKLLTIATFSVSVMKIYKTLLLVCPWHVIH